MIPECKKQKNRLKKIEEDTGWVFITDFSGNKTGSYRKTGKVVEVNIYIYTSNGYSLDGYEYNVIGNLPIDIRPDKLIAVPVFIRTLDGNFPTDVKAELKTNGTVSLFNWGNTKTIETASAIITYIC